MLLKKESPRDKWAVEMFKYHGIKRVFRNFKSDSCEVVLFENFLSNFYQTRSTKTNKVFLMGNLDYEEYESKFKEAGENVFNALRSNIWEDGSKSFGTKPEFEIVYEDLTMYVILK